MVNLLRVAIGCSGYAYFIQLVLYKFNTQDSYTEFWHYWVHGLTVL